MCQKNELLEDSGYLCVVVGFFLFFWGGGEGLGNFPPIPDPHAWKYLEKSWKNQAWNVDLTKGEEP